MNNDIKTIYALSTTPGKSAIALVRISGPQAYGAVKKISINMPKKNNMATLNDIKSEKGLAIDQTITTFYKSPKSFTGEDVVEIATHGGKAVIKTIFEIFSKHPEMRLASPGEFTRWAFENNIGVICFALC